MNSEPAPVDPGEILTFYSYKGGTGRTMVLANTACLLAQQPEGNGGVLIVDWDLEAPGLHHYFADRLQTQFANPKTSSHALERHPGLIDFFIALSAEIAKLPQITEEPTPEVQKQLRLAVSLDSYILRTDVPNVYLLKAGAFDESYAKRVNTFPWEPIYNRAPWMISLVAKWFTRRFRYTLIDSRTGITDTSGICTMLLPDKLVTVFTPNRQSLDGVLQMVERSTNYRRRSSDLRPLSVFPLPSRIETNEPELRERWRKDSSTGYQPQFEALFRKVWELQECNLETYFNEVQIQHSSAYAYGEKIAVLLEKSDDRTSLRRAYGSFVERLALDDPWSVLEQIRTLRVAAVAESVYVQLKHGEKDSAKTLFLHLVSFPQDALKPVGRERPNHYLSDESRSAVLPFVAAKVLSVNPTDDGTFISLADESLVYIWRRLSEWIAADVDFLRWRDALDAGKANWEKFGRSKEGLLRGPPLREAEASLHKWLLYLNSEQFGYIFQSTKADKARRRLRLWWAAVAAAALILFLAFIGPR